MSASKKIMEKITGISPLDKVRPTILLIDSGVGGLSVYDEVRKLLPNARYLYVFDNAAFPYGEKSEQLIIERVLAMTAAMSQQFPISLAIIACNTASTISLPPLREKFSFPVVGVVPAIKPAAEMTKNRVVGLLATQGTVRRAYTQDLVTQFAQACHIEMIGSSALVELAELKLQGQLIESSAIDAILSPWTALAVPPDTIVLGCTHFPLVREELQRALPSETRLIDSGAAIAKRAVWLLQHQVPLTSTPGGNIAFCTKLDRKTHSLEPVIARYGFSSLKKLTVMTALD